MYQYKQRLSAKEMHEYDNNCTREHHLRRVAWLSDNTPVWGCGTPVGKHDQIEMLRASKQYLTDGVAGGRMGGSGAPIPYRNDVL